MGVLVTTLAHLNYIPHGMLYQPLLFKLNCHVLFKWVSVVCIYSLRAFFSRKLSGFLDKSTMASFKKYWGNSLLYVACIYLILGNLITYSTRLNSVLHSFVLFLHMFHKINDNIIIIILRDSLFTNYPLHSLHLFVHMFLMITDNKITII